MDDEAAAAAQMANLGPLTENLAKSVKCPICLDYMDNAMQFHCGHIHCAECVTHILSQASAQIRCPMCKVKTGKRSVRPAPLSFHEIVECLHELELIVAQANPMPKTSSGDACARLRKMQEMARARSAQYAASAEVPGAGAAGSHSRMTCALCPKGVDTTSFGAAVCFGEVKPAVVSAKKKPVFVHEQCALYSAGVYEVNNQFVNVERVLNKAAKAACKRDACGRSRANVTCAASGCAVKYHFPCAVLENAVMVEDGFKMFCRDHAKLAPDIDGDFEENLSDPTGTQALEHNDFCYKCEVGGRLLMCDTCSRVTHPVCSGLKAIPLGEWSCAVCTGAEGPGTQVAAETAKAIAARGSKENLKPTRQPDNELMEYDTDESGAQKSEKAPAKSKRRRQSVPKARLESVSAPQRRSSSSKRRRRSAGDGPRYFLVHTGLNETQKELLGGVAGMKKTVVSRNLDSRTTHLVVNAFTPNEAPTRTIKLCNAIAAGIPIVCLKWIEDSAGSGDSWTDIAEHIHPWSRTNRDVGLFQDMRFYFGGFRGMTGQKQDLVLIVQAGGGTVLHREPTAEMTPSHTAIYFVQDDKSRKAKRRRELLASQAQPVPGVTVISPTWILDRCTVGDRVAPSSVRTLGG